jgi:molybdate transport system permease protein
VTEPDPPHPRVEYSAYSGSGYGSPDFRGIGGDLLRTFPPLAQPAPARPRSDAPFLAGLVVIGGLYVVLIVAMVAADAAYLVTDPTGKGDDGVGSGLSRLVRPLAKPEIRYAVKLSLISCAITAILSVWVAVPLGYLMSRYEFRGKGLVDAVIDVPIVLPPLVVGLSLLILFQTAPGRAVERVLPITYAIPAVILAQFSVACAFAVRTMRVTFDQISPRREQVARTLGCTRAQAFWRVVLPEARGGMITAATVAWARALGEFGPILVFAGATRMKTEVLSTTIFLELSVGNLEAAVAVSLLMVLAAVLVLVVLRWAGGPAKGW